MRALALVLGAIGMVASCTFPDVQFGDASAPIDTGTDVVQPNEAGVDSGDPCDKDHDGYKDMNNGCGGNDCNDDDSRYHPGQDWVYDVPDAAPWGDWNCDGDAEPRYKPATCGLTFCNSEGYANSSGAGCGITNPWVSCTAPVTCAPVDAGMQTQGCR
jgi:hypothetical protein